MKIADSSQTEVEERPLVSIHEIAEACAPDRVMPRKCVGCIGFDEDPDHCATCYANLYPRGSRGSL